MRRWPDWFDAVLYFLVFAAGMTLLALSAIGCGGPAPLGVSGVVVPEGPVFYEDVQGDRSSLVFWPNGDVVFSTGLEAYACGRTRITPPFDEVELGPPILVARAFKGSFFGLPQVGDVVTGTVIQSTVIDTFLVTEGSFRATFVAANTCSVVAYLRVPSLAGCGRDSMTRIVRVAHNPAGGP